MIEMPTVNLSKKEKTLLVVSLLSCFLSLTRTEAAGTYVYHVCSNETTFTPNSTYQSNLNYLLSSLSSNATRNIEFYNVTAGGSTDNTTYGLFLCRGDVTADVCQDCVSSGTKDIAERCPVEKVAVVWYEECLLRYSNQSFFSSMVQNPGFYLSNTTSISEPNRFNQLMVETMNELKSRLASVRSGAKKFATKEVNFTGFQTLYTLVQCTPDLSGTDCDSCLGMVISNVPLGKVGARFVIPSCNARYEIYPFYRATEAAPTPTAALVPPPKGKSQITSLTIVAIVTPISISVVLFVMGYCFLRRRARKDRKQNNTIHEDNAANEIPTAESLQFDFDTLQAATDNFLENNKIGEGGFGEVYKGILPNGQEIAVKRLSKSSGQGVGEFKNEIVLVAKLQHRNLLRILGFCFEGQEKIVVYEFVPNKSLDYFLYDPEKQGLLNWPRRYKIIEGIARGILYLHEDSRLRIIHRDLKASNILLDHDMNPKISDFGMARIFGVDQTQGTTRRIVGTYGYMSPEYAMHGRFSVKSDVYSFGVLVLEILTGKKNNSFYQSNGAKDLLSYAWKHWRDGTPVEMLDPTLRDSYSRNEVIRCIHIGLLCVQDDPSDRPTMASIVLMLNSYSVTLSVPRQPTFSHFSRTAQNMPTKVLESDESTSKSIPLSINEVSITEVYPR